jgi:hypothetical protein
MQQRLSLLASEAEVVADVTAYPEVHKPRSVSTDVG